MKVRISSIEQESLVNGPGRRAVVWLQGCSIGRTNPCKGCFNSHTWTLTGGTESDTQSIADQLNRLDIRGVTFSGGDPLDQVDAVIDIISKLNKNLDTMVFTGFEMEEILLDENKKKILSAVDLLKSGRYKPEFHSNESAWRGSSNQQLHYLTARIKKEEESVESRVELIVKNDGTVTMTGFPSSELIVGVKKLK